MINKWYCSIKSKIMLKLTVFYLLIVLLPISFSAGFIIKISNDNARREILDLVSSQLTQISNDITERLDTCRHNAEIVAKDKNINNLIQNSNIPDYALISVILNDIIPKMEAIRGQNKYIHSLRVIHGDENVPVIFDYLYFQPSFNNGGWDKYTNPTINEYLLWASSTHVAPPSEEIHYIKSTAAKNQKVFTLYTPIYSSYRDRILAVVETTLLENTVFAPLIQVDFNGYQNILLINSGDRIIYSKHNIADIPILSYQELNNLEGPIRLSYANESLYISKKYIESIDSWLVAYIPDHIIGIQKNYTLFILNVVIIGLLTLTVLYYYLMKTILKRLFKLSSAMDMVKNGDFNVRLLDSKQNDEIDKLIYNFNDMIHRIIQLMANLENANRAEKEAIYKALENQINPHFLYNALESIKMTAELHDDKEVVAALELMSSYFKYNLRYRDRYISLYEEIKGLKAYLKLSNMLMNNRLKYQINVCKRLTSKLHDYYLLKFIIQPVVENSIKHGFKNGEDGCYIVINLKLENNEIHISIEDNGISIPPDRLERLRKYVDPQSPIDDFTTTGNGIGLRNINERLIINYGPDYALGIESLQGCGTIVLMRVPVV